MAHPAKENGAASRLRVLILEDQPADAELMVRELGRAGFAAVVQRAMTETEFLAALDTRPDLILADYSLPQFTALDALQHLQVHGLDTPFIVVTGTISEDAAVQCMQRGAADYLLKDRLARLGPAVARAMQERQLREQKRRAEERFQHLVEAVRVIPCELELPQVRFSYVGPQAQRLLGYPVEEWYGEQFWPRRLHPDDREKVLALLRNTHPLQDHEFECRMLTATGAILWMHAVMNVAKSNGHPSLLRGFLIDISALKRAEERLERQTRDLARSNAELEQFAYVASHDLQEPLRMVSSYTQLLAARYLGRLDAAADDFIAFAQDGAARMRQLIDDLLAYSRVSSRGHVFAPTDCETVLEQALANLRMAITESGARIAHGPLPTLKADASQLTAVFQNLVGNALKFRTARAPDVHIAAVENGEEWHFSVADNGIGIDPQYFQRIFVIFQRLHTREEYDGTGIGLTICKRIVERHGGRIWVESEPGNGSTFHFILPKEHKAS